MIFVGLGANLPSPEFGTPRATLMAALEAFAARGIHVAARSRWYRSAPVPVSDQPWFVNGVVRVETGLGPESLLAVLHEIEAAFGRHRRQRGEARILDLDLLAFHNRISPGHNRISPGKEGALVLPHPRLHLRAFVLLPLAEIAPDWRHPRLGGPISALIAGLAEDQDARPISGFDSSLNSAAASN